SIVPVRHRGGPAKIAPVGHRLTVRDSAKQRRLSSASQVGKPPIAPPRLHAGKPFTEWVEQEHAAGPRKVNYPKPESVARRRICKLIDRRLEKPVNGLAESKMEEDSDGVRGEPLQDVEEKR